MSHYLEVWVDAGDGSRELVGIWYIYINNIIWLVLKMCRNLPPNPLLLLFNRGKKCTDSHKISFACGLVCPELSLFLPSAQPLLPVSLGQAAKDVHCSAVQLRIMPASKIYLTNLSRRDSKSFILPEKLLFALK